MKFLLLFLLFSPFVMVQAQPAQVAHLPAGTYQVQNNDGKSFKGDIVLIDDSHYKLSGENTVGEYKFSATAQRILFLSGTLKGAFARTVISGTDPTIVLPRKENEELGFKLIQTDLQAFYKKN
jgi:hypothetical protein